MVEPWSTIVQYWRDTSKQRILHVAILHVESKCRVTNRNKNKANVNVKNKFKNKAILKTAQVQKESKEVQNISSYINKYPALKENLGYTLVNI